MVMEPMGMKQQPRVVWDTSKVVADRDLRGWSTHTLATRAGLSYKTVDRFLNGEVQTAKTALKIATAMGYSIRRYFSHVEAVAS